MNEFKPYGVTTTEYILPAAAVISCGAKLHSCEETGEDPCIRKLVKTSGRSEIKTLFQFHEMTSGGVKVQKLLEAYKKLDFGEPCGLPEAHTLCVARKVLVERHRLHLWFQKLMEEPVSGPGKGYSTNRTQLAAILSCLGHPIREARRVSETSVAFFFEDSPASGKLVEAYGKPWGEYDLDEDHPLYHMKGALENRETLIVLLKRASVRVEVKQNGKRFFLPVNASKEKLAAMITKLNQ